MSRQVEHGYIKNDFDVSKWAAPVFFEKAATELLIDEVHRKKEAMLPPMGVELASQLASCLNRQRVEASKTPLAQPDFQFMLSHFLIL